MYRYYLLIFLIIFFNTAFASLELNELLKKDTKNALVYFKQDEVNDHKISMLHLHFLEGDDCYSGFLTQFDTQNTDHAFSVNKGDLFLLDSVMVFKAAREQVDADAINRIHSLLLRILTNERGSGYEKFARFIGTCQDQGINCCIPISCSNQTSECYLRANLEIQPIRWN